MEPLYFYHVVNKNADLSKGLLSLQYMYDHKMYSLFDAYTEKYKDRITNDWKIEKYQGKKTLTREEILDGLASYRGEKGASYLYFFRYPLKRKLGKKIDRLLEEKDLYRIDINDPKTKDMIVDIFYGYKGSMSDHEKLTRRYYETVSEKEYFKDYDDSISMNFKNLNHIAIAFRNDYCPIELLEKCDIVK